MPLSRIILSEFLLYFKCFTDGVRPSWYNIKKKTLEIFHRQQLKMTLVIMNQRNYRGKILNPRRIYLLTWLRMRNSNTVQVYKVLLNSCEAAFSSVVYSLHWVTELTGKLRTLQSVLLTTHLPKCHMILGNSWAPSN